MPDTITIIDDRTELVENPWQSRGLEWTTPSPPPLDNFAEIPVVVSGPYEYGTGAGPMAVFSVASDALATATATDGEGEGS